MNARFLKYGLYVLVVIAIMGGTVISITDAPLRSLCRKDCWLNGMLSMLLGEQNGKYLLAGLWYGVAILLLILALKIKP